MTNNGASKEPSTRNYPLSQIFFYLTEGCNLRCRHCWIDPKYQSTDKTYSVLDINHFKKIIGQAKPLGLSGVKLTGGEPLLHPHIYEILEIIRLEGISLTVETNGVLCTSPLAQVIAQCKSPFVSVSLDGSDAETHEWVRGVKGCFDNALEGIRNLIHAGLKPQIIMTILQHNHDQIESVVRLAESLGVASVKFNIVQPTARGKTLKDTGESLNIEELVEIGRWVENSLSKDTKLSLIVHHPHVFRHLSNIFSNGCGVCDILHILGVLSDGSYAMCGIGETVPELVYGHVVRDSLMDVWKNTPILNEIREGLPERLEGICRDCLMKRLCLGSCIAVNYYRSKSLWAPFWYCQEAKDAGLFPESRLR